jgi:hypothetical protein
MRLSNFEPIIFLRRYEMGKAFRPSNRESSLLSKIESSKEHERRRAISGIRDCIEPLANAISMKLIENKLVETTNKNSMEEQIRKCLEKLGRSDDFEIDYQIAMLRNLVNQPNVVSLYITSFVIEQLIKHKDIIDVFGSDEEIYISINRQVEKYVPQ